MTCEGVGVVGPAAALVLLRMELALKVPSPHLVHSAFQAQARVCTVDPFLTDLTLLCPENSRTIFKLHTTFIDRNNTNKEVRKRAAAALYPPKPQGKGKGKGKHAAKGQGKGKDTPTTLPKISTTVKNAQQTFLLHVHAPTRQATFKGT